MPPTFPNLPDYLSLCGRHPFTSELLALLLRLFALPAEAEEQ